MRTDFTVSAALVATDADAAPTDPTTRVEELPRNRDSSHTDATGSDGSCPALDWVPSDELDFDPLDVSSIAAPI